jgi:cell division protein FtsI/penicillin-binding protein 2
MTLDGVYSRKEPKRYYPNDNLAAHVPRVCRHG